MDEKQVEAEIAELERAEASAVLSGDVGFLAGIWHPDYLVNAPHNQVVLGSKEVLEMVRAKVIAYDRFDRVTEAIVVHGDTAIAMGYETVCPLYGPQAGTILTRRHSNVYQRRTGGKWGMIARHAHVIEGKGQNLDMPIVQ